MAYTTRKKTYLGFIIAGAVASAAGGALLILGTVYAWMGGLFQSVMDDMSGMSSMPDIPMMFRMIGIGMAIGGGIALPVGLILLGVGVSKKKAYNTATAPASETISWRPETSVGREYAYSPTPAYGTISAPVSTPAPMVMRCRSCGEVLPERIDVLFCPSCGAPTR